MNKIYQPIFFVILFILSFGCENRDINEGEAFQPREIHEDIVFHFDKIKVDGIEYLILEKDNNNPHEGFGFMAFRANRLMEKQDTIMAYIQTVNDVQTRLYAKMYNMSLEQAQREVQGIFEKNLSKEYKELKELQNSNLTGETRPTEKD